METPCRRISLLLILTITSLGFAMQAALAGNGDWTLAGIPPGGSVLAVVVNPSNPANIYAVSGPGVYESTDSGANWSLVLSLPTNQASDIAVAPGNPVTLFVATEGSGVYKSSDGGNTWTSMNSGIATIAGGNPDSVYRIATDPTNDGVAYIATLNTGVYKTANGGQSWSQINTGISQLQFSGSQINRLLVDPLNPQVLYLADNVFTGPGLPGTTSVQGVYTSTDGGSSWTASLSGVPAFDVAINPSNVAQVYETNVTGIDSLGSSGWTSLPAAPPSPYVMRVDPSNGSNLFVGTYFNGLYQSADGGSTWTVDNIGPASYITSIAFDPTNSQHIYVSSINWGVLASTDGGSTWNAENDGIQDVQINNMIMGNDGVIYMGTNGEGVYKSSDGGMNWTLVNDGITASPGLTGITVNALADNPSAPSTVYAGTVIGLYRTTDSGSTWTLLNNGITDAYTMSVAVDPKTPTTIYDGTETAGVFKSVDNGASWQSASNGITDPEVISLAVNPANDAIVFAGTSSGGLFKSTDGGNTWAPDNGAMPVTGIWSIAIDPQNPNTIYASAENNEIYKSTDGGGTWVSSSNGIPPGYIISAINIDPNNTQILYATLLDNYGVYESTDGGSSWTALTSGLPTSAVAKAQTRSVNAGMRTGIGKAAGNPVEITAVAPDPQQAGVVFGASNNGAVYSYTNPPSGTSGGGSGGPGGGSSGGAGSSGTSGGGGAAELAGLLLLAGLLGVQRRGSISK